MRKLVGACVVLLIIGGAAGAQESVQPRHMVDWRPRLFWWALPSDTGHGVGYHVGGGAGQPHKAEPRHEEGGTWGWDYQGWLIRRRVNLGWWHGRRFQGGVGAYQAEGARLHQPR